MGMEMEVLPPTMQDREEADFSTQMIGVRRDRLQCFRRGLEEYAKHDLFILVSDRGDLFRHSEDHMKIGNLEKFRLPVLDPLRPSQALAFWAMSIPATIEGIAFIA